jgi:UDP-N-acetylmuramoylalanine--D-glutamate ligase
MQLSMTQGKQFSRPPQVLMAQPAGLGGAGRVTHSSRACQLVGSPQHAVIVGLGRSGLACARFLTRLGLRVDVYDSQAQPALAQRLQREAPAASLVAGSLRVRHWQQGSMLVMSPGVPLTHPELAPLLDRGVRPVGDVELFAQCVQAPVIAITGSNGKSTVTQLVGEILRGAGVSAAVGGNIGIPVLELLDRQADVYVLELSSFQLETTWSLDAAIATVLNVAADHMDRYPGIAQYAAAKARIFNGHGVMLLNRDDETCRGFADEQREALWFGSAAPKNDNDYGLLHRADELWLMRGDQALIRAAEIPLPGRHNALNVLAAWAMCASYGVDDEAIAKAVRDFHGLPHRMQWVRQRHGVDWINDSKGTNVGATLAAVTGLAQPLVLIAGGLSKDADFAPLAEALHGRARAVVLIGRDAPHIAACLGDDIPVSFADSMRDAVHDAAQLARPGDVVLLSPACASFDMYSGFAARGDDFRAAVEGLPE